MKVTVTQNGQEQRSSHQNVFIRKFPKNTNIALEISGLWQNKGNILYFIEMNKYCTRNNISVYLCVCVCER